MSRLTFPIILVTLFTHADSPAQGEAAFPFLLISPYAEANGMGEASIALHADAPLAHITNPAHLGMWSQRNTFSFDYNFSSWLPSFSNVSYQTFGFDVGFNLQNLNEDSPSLSIGLTYSRIHLNLGEFIVTRSDGSFLGTFDAYESSDQYTVGVGLDYYLRASAGIAFKRVRSKIAPIGPGGQIGNEPVSVNLYDYGFFLEVPLVSILSRLREEPINVLPYMSPIVDFSVGIARNNLGAQQVIYIDAAQADPLPRYARAGIGFHLALQYANEGLVLNPISFTWTVEANDLLVRRLPQSGWEYQGGLGDIDFFREVISGKTSSETIKKKGWEFDFFEIVSLRGGRFEEDVNRGNRRFSTSGYGVRLAGILKLLRSTDTPPVTDSVLRFIIDHIDIRYNHSEYTTDQPSQPLSNTRFDALSVVLVN